MTAFEGESASTPRQVEIVLRPRGIARYFEAGFLALWLCGWLAGEVFVLFFLLAGLYSVVTGTPLGNDTEPLALFSALIVGLFLLIWLALWTLGGYGASRELLRILWSEDVIGASREGLFVLRRLGPFRSTVEVPVREIRRLYCSPRGDLLKAETTSGHLELSSLLRFHSGSEALAELERALQLDAASRPELRSPPALWKELVASDGARVLVENEDTRGTRARISWAAAAMLALLALAGDSVMAALVFGGLAALVAWASWRLSFSRLEWRLEPGALRLRRQWSSRSEELFRADRLALSESEDSDGDRCFELHAFAGVAVADESYFERRRRRRRLLREMGDGTAARQLAEWIAARCGLPVTTERQ